MKDEEEKRTVEAKRRGRWSEKGIVDRRMDEE